MKRIHRIIAAFGLAALLLCMMNVSVFAQEATTTNRFPEGVIEVPQGTAISIDDDAGTVTITNSPVDITAGDTFVVYLQDLPIGYVANSISKQGDCIVVSVEKADKSVYALLDEEGDIALTPDMYEFIPGPNVTYAKSGSTGIVIGGDGLQYQDGKLSMIVALGESNVTVTISNLHLSHSFSGGSMGLGLSGNWGIQTTLSTSEDLLSDLPLGDIRIMGIGKIGFNLSFTQSVSMKCNISGTFNVGITTTQEGEGTAKRGFTVTDQYVEGKGSITASLKITAGVDVVVVAADLYVDIGLKTQYTMKNTFHEAPEEPVRCDDFRIYVFSTVGVEAMFQGPMSGKMRPLASKELAKVDESNSPFFIDVHFENGKLVNRCTQGMIVPVLQLGGFDADFTGTILTDDRERILETSIDLPWDITIEKDLTLSHGTLNLNGHTLIVEGNLIQSGGTLTIGNGTLIVKGDYRIQSYHDGEYGDSDGSLVMTNSNGSISIGGDFVVQTNSTSNKLSYGTIDLTGNFYQKNTAKNNSNFNSGSGLNLILNSEQSHIIQFENSEKNSIGRLTLDNEVTIDSSICIGIMDNNGHDMTVNGNLMSTQSIDMYDYNPMAPVVEQDNLVLSGAATYQSVPLFKDIDLSGHQLTVNGDMISTGYVNLNSGVLKVSGSLYHWSGTIFFNLGKLHITGNYYSVGSNSCFEPGKENITNGAGYLKMIYAADEMRVGGDFLTATVDAKNELTAGTLYLSGNFTQRSSPYSGYFNAAAAHKTVLDGTRAQVISFKDSYSGFGTLEASNDQLVFQNNVSWYKQASDIHATSNGAVLRGHDIDMNGHQLTINGDIKVYSNINVKDGKFTINGDIEVYSGININNGQLTVNGSMNHRSGTINLNGGKLHITGNYHSIGAGSTFEPGKENITDSTGYLKMTYAADEMRVDGDFLVKTDYAYSKLTAGTLYISGDFKQLKGYSHSNNFAPTVNHKTVLNGTGEQVISFQDSYSGFGTLEATNKQLVFQNNVSWYKQVSDIHATSNEATLRGHDIDMNGHQLTIDGDIKVYSGININNGQLTVNGSMNHRSGTINLNGGKLHITGNYHSIGAGSTFEPGKENITDSTGYLKMTYAADEMRVDGDYLYKPNYGNHNELAAGTLYVSGNFTQLNGSYNTNNSFSRSVEHKIVLNGTGEQVISFQDSLSGFGTLEATNKQLVFQNNVSWYKQVSDIHATSNGAMLRGHDIDMNGHQLTIDGDIKVYSGININNCQLTVNGSMSHRSGTINLNGGKLHITGNYHSIGAGSTIEPGKENITDSTGYLKMTYAADEMRVGGDFLVKTYYAYSKLTAGTLYVSGNFKQLKGNSHRNNFAPAVDHKTVLNGTGAQTVSFQCDESGFGTLEAINEQLMFQNNVSWYKQASDIHATSNEAVLRSRNIDMNGHQLTIDGDIKVYSNIDIKNGQLTVNGSMYHRSGTINLNGGKLHISGNYYSIGADSTFEPGKENITDSVGYLQMTYAADEMRVGGDFLVKTYYAYSKLTAGTLYVSGNFKQLKGYSASNNFAPAVNHKTLLNGSGIKYISFESTSSHFGTLQLCQPTNMYVFSPEKCWIAICESLASGSSGDLSWVLTSDGILTFTGSGAMENYPSEAGTPWYSYANQISSVVIESGATGIGSYAFYGIPSLQSIQIPATVTSIGNYAIKNAAIVYGNPGTMMKLSLPKGTVTVEEAAFQDCVTLESVLIPAGVKGIGALAFDGCTRLNAIVFSGSAPTIAANAFAGVTATVYYPENDTTWTAQIMQNYGGTLTWVPYAVK